MTSLQLAINSRALAKHGIAPFQDQSIVGRVDEYINAGGVIHKIEDGKTLCGNSDGVGYVKKNSGITCLLCRREMNKRIRIKKGRAA